MPHLRGPYRVNVWHSARAVFPWDDATRPWRWTVEDPRGLRVIASGNAASESEAERAGHTQADAYTRKPPPARVLAGRRRKNPELILLTNPDDGALLARIRFVIERAPAWSAGKSGAFVSVRAFDGSRQVGEAQFKVGRSTLRPWNHGVYVEPEYRRKGLASALYREAEWKMHPTRRYTVKGTKDRTDDGKRFVRGRRNPDVSSTWASINGAPRSAVHGVRVPDVSGVPAGVASLGLMDQIEAGGRTLAFSKDYENGPWLATDASKRRLLIVARSAAFMRRLAPLVGQRVKAVSYFPENKRSAKYDRLRGFRHAFGDGGPLPEARWREAWPKLKSLSGGRAYEFVAGPFRIQGKWIVN